MSSCIYNLFPSPFQSHISSPKPLTPLKQGKPTMKKTFATSFLFFLLLTTTTTFSLAARPADSFPPEPKAAVAAANGNPPVDPNNKGFGSGTGPGNGFFGPGGGFGVPNFGNGWENYGGGYGAGYGGPSGGYAKGGTTRPTVVCKEKGPCYKKKLTCPAKCFTSYSRSGKNYGAGGGGGGCTIDCKKCTAYC